MPAETGLLWGQQVDFVGRNLEQRLPLRCPFNSVDSQPQGLVQSLRYDVGVHTIGQTCSH